MNINVALQEAIQLHELGHLSEAENIYTKILTLNPRHSDALHLLGVIAYQGMKPLMAIQLIQQALNIIPKPHYYNNLGSAYKKIYRLNDAKEAYKKALSLKPDFSEACQNLGTIFQEEGDLLQAIKNYKKALRMDPENQQAHSNLIVASYANGSPAADIFKLAKQWKQPLLIPVSENKLTPISGRKIKVAYLSADFRDHSVAGIIRMLFENHERNQFEIYAYSNVSSPDADTECLEGLVDHWRYILFQSDEQVVQQIKSDQIDILVDLSGHTSGNRLQIFTYQAAPVQLTGLGYGCTSGLQSIQFRLSDPFITPLKEIPFNAEKIVYLKCLVRWKPPETHLNIQPPPMIQKGYITFGCGNTLAKINREVIEVWSRILSEVKDSKIHLKTKQFDDEELVTKYKKMFEASGIEANRVLLSGSSSHQEHLEFYHSVDIALDPFPYQGGITTCETLWMGVPVVTWYGGTFVGQALLNIVGLSELIAESKQSYIDLAVSLALNVENLKKLRLRVRNMLLDSPICDGIGFARELEAIYRQSLLELEREH